MKGIKYKHKVVDTNILLENPLALYSFEPKESGVVTTIYIPIAVMRELEKFKNEKSERGMNARAAIREIRDIVNGKEDLLIEGVKINENYIIQSTYRIEKERPDALHGLVSEGTDKILLEILQKLKDEKKDVELITLDLSLQLIGRSMGLPVSEWKDYKVKETYKGWKEIQVGYEVIEMYHKIKNDRKSGIPLDSINETPFPNEYFIVGCGEGKGKQVCLVRYDADKKLYVPLRNTSFNSTKTKAQNPRQSFFIDSLMNPDISITFAIGPAGTGKTFLAANAGIELVIMGHLNDEDSKKEYRKMIITRPIVGIDEEDDLGALPGELEEKLKPWMKPIWDNLEMLFVAMGKKDVDKEGLMQNDIIELQTLRAVRGRSLPFCYYIIDEAQNLTRKSIKALGTRMGDSSKIVFTGDPDQSDLKLVHESSSPLIYAGNASKIEPNASVIHFEDEDCVRSDIAKAFIRMMGK